MTATFRPGTASDGADLSALLAGLSPDSAYARFQGALGSGSPPAVLDALLPEGARGEALLAWQADEPVAHGLWVRVGPGAAGIALVVTDTHQRRGIGSALADRLVAAAADRGLERIEVFSAAGNRAVARMVARRAPTAAPQRDGLTVSYSVDLRQAQRTKLLPSDDTSRALTLRRVSMMSSSCPLPSRLMGRRRSSRRPWADRTAARCRSIGRPRRTPRSPGRSRPPRPRR